MGRCYLSQLLEECILINSFSREVMKNFTINVFWKQSVPHPTSCKSFLFFNRKSEGIWRLITQFWVTKRLFVCYFWGFLHVSSSVTSPKFSMIHPSIYTALESMFFLRHKNKGWENSHKHHQNKEAWSFSRLFMNRKSFTSPLQNKHWNNQY